MQPLNLFSLSAYDWLMLAVALLSVCGAFRSGLVRTVFSLSGLIAGLLVATSAQTVILNSLGGYATFDAATRKMIFLGIVFGVYAAFTSVSVFVRKVATGAGTGLADRFAGAGLGLVRGALLGAIFLAAVTGFAPHSPIVRSSVFAPYLIEGTQATALLDPETFTYPADPGTNQILPALQQELEARSTNEPAPQ